MLCWFLQCINSFVFFFNDTATPGIYTLSLPDALPISRAQIRAYVHGHIHNRQDIPDILTAWHRANDLKQAEEFRLLYVAMTRAKRLLWMSAAKQAPFAWSNPDNLQEADPCPVLPALGQFMRR